jgi:hypothetical protein
VPVWSQAFFDLLTTRVNIRHSLRNSFVRGPDEALIHYAYLTAHQPGARFAPLHFLSGHLAIDGIRQFYGGLSMPVLVLADEDDYLSVDALPEFVSQRPNWRVTSVPGTRSLPHFENITGTLLAMDDFWRRLPVAAAIEG